MKTSIEEARKYIEQGSGIKNLLLQYFGQEACFTFCDIGACDGLDSIIYANLFPKTIIHAIEAREDNYTEMVMNIERFEKKKQIIPHHLCLNDKDGTVSFYKSFGDSGHKKEWDTGNKSSSILKPEEHIREHPWCRFEKTVIVTKRYEQLVELPQRFDFLHLDVQGAELNALKGMSLDTLRNIQAIYLEVSNIKMYSGQPLKTDIQKFMYENNFCLKMDTCTKYSGDQFYIKEKK
jgi:FkbM family methyltransferase